MATKATGSETIDACNAIKAELRAAYPDAGFRVGAVRFMGGLAIIINQVDGPEFFDILARVKAYGSTFAEDQDEPSVYLQEDGGQVLPIDSRSAFMFDGRFCKIIISRR